MMKMLINSQSLSTISFSCHTLTFCSRNNQPILYRSRSSSMEEKPTKTINLIDKLMHAAESPLTASSSRISTGEDHQQLCEAATALTLHQSLLQLVRRPNKRKAEASDCRDVELKNRGDPETECDNAVNLHTTTAGSARPSVHQLDHEQVARDPALYKIKKKLTESDLGHLSRLLVPKEMVREHVLRFVDSDFEKILKSKEGAQVTVIDSDKETEHQLTFRYLSSSKSYVFNGKWRTEFVKRRDLKKDDEIGLYWDTVNSKFHFSRLEAAGQERQ